MHSNHFLNFIKNNAGTTVFSLFGTFLWSIFKTHFTTTYHAGYLEYFNVNSSYNITNILSMSSMPTFFLYLMVILSLFIIPYCSKALHPEPAGNSKSKYVIIHTLIYIFSYYIFFFCLLAYYIKLQTKANLIDIMLLMLKHNWSEIGVISIMYSVAGIIFIGNDISKHIHSFKSNFKLYRKKIISFILLFTTIFSFLFIYFIDNFFLSLGSMSASLQNIYPSFTKEGTEYIVIAEMDENKYLTISIQNQSEDTICIIQDISNIPLIDKNIENIFLNY